MIKTACHYTVSCNLCHVCSGYRSNQLKACLNFVMTVCFGSTEYVNTLFINRSLGLITCPTKGHLRWILHLFQCLLHFLTRSNENGPRWTKGAHLNISILIQSETRQLLSNTITVGTLGTVTFFTAHTAWRTPKRVRNNNGHWWLMLHVRGYFHIGINSLDCCEYSWGAR